MSDDDDIPKGATLMCMTVADSTVIFADNKRCPCAVCGVEIHHRPYVPDHIRKLCIRCVAKEAAARGEDVIFTTQQRALDEARLYLSKTERKQ